MSPARSSTHITVMPAAGLAGRVLTVGRVRAWCESRSRSTDLESRCQVRVPAGACVFLRCCQAVRVPGYGSSVGACATARKPLASLGLGLTAALRVRSVALLAPGAALSDTQPAPTGRRRTR